MSGVFPFYRSPKIAFEMSMSTIQVIVDDADIGASGYGGIQWVHEKDQVDTYGGTLSVCHVGNPPTTGFSSPPSLLIDWDGSDMVVYGTMTKGVAATYSRDFGPSQPVVFSNSAIGKPGVELWKTTGLLSADHTLSVKPTAGNLTIDYVTYTPTSLTSLDGHNLVFDDQDPALQYSKGWVGTIQEQFPQGVPYLGTTTGTKTVGSSMALNFTGKVVAVYGALQQVPGKLTVSFSVDNGKPIIFTPYDGTQANTSEWFVASQMFQTSIPEGPHTLHVSLQEATGSQMLRLDSVITQADFTTTLSNAAGSGSGSSISGGVAPVPTFDASTASNSGLSGGAIGGIAGGGVFGLAVLVYVARVMFGKKGKNGVSDNLISNGLTSMLTCGAS